MIARIKDETSPDPHSEAAGSFAHQWFPEAMFYAYLFMSAFAYAILYIPNLTPALLSATTLIASLKSPSRLKWLILPALTLSIMAIIDFLGYRGDMEAIKYYLFWTLMFAVCLVLHEDPGFFDRAKNVLAIYLLCHFFFLQASPVDENRLGLSEKMSISNPNDLGYWCAFGVFMGLIASIRSAGLKRILYSSFALIALIVLFRTVSRSALIFLAFSVATYLFLSIREKRRFYSVLFALALLAVSGLAFKHFLSDGMQAYRHRMEYEEDKGNYSFSGRTYYLQEGIRAVIASPWYGTGEDEISPREASKPSAAPHNVFVAVALHYGIWPTLFLAILWLITLVRAISLTFWIAESRRHDHSNELFAFTLFLFLMSNVSNKMMLAPFCILYMTKVLTADSIRETRRYLTGAG